MSFLSDKLVASLLTALVIFSSVFVISMNTIELIKEYKNSKKK